MIPIMSMDWFGTLEALKSLKKIGRRHVMKQRG